MFGLRRIGLGILCAKAFLVPIFFDPGALIAFAQPKALIGHGLSVLLVGAMAAIVVQERLRPRRPARLEWLALALGLTYVLATATAVDQRLALFGAHDRALGLTTLLDQILFFFAVRFFVRSRAELLALALSVAAAATIAVAYETVQKLGRDPLVWSADPLGVRPSSTLGNADALAVLLVTVGSIAASVALLPDRSGTIPRRVRVWASVLSAIWLVAAFVTGTRAVLFGLGAAALILSAWSIVLAGSGRARAISAAIAVGATFVLLLTIAITPLGRSFQSALSSASILLSRGSVPVEGSVAGRLDIYRVALEELSDRPILGVGPDNFVAVYPPHRSAAKIGQHESSAPQTSTHSWVLKVLTDAGLLGLVAFLATVALSLRAAVTAPDPIRVSAAVGLIAWLGAGTISINDVGTDWLPWVLFGLASVALPAAEVTVLPQRERGRARAERRAAPWAVLLAVLLGLAGVVAIVAEARAWGAARAAESARLARAQGNAALAVQASEKATEQDGGRAEHWNGLGLGLAAQGRFDRAATAFKRAMEMAPYEPTYVSNLVRAYAALATTQPPYRQLALDLARKAMIDHPNVPELYWTLALALFADGRPDVAAATAEQAIASGAIGSDGLVEERTGRYYASLGRSAEAEKWLQRAIVDLPGRAGFDARLALAQLLLQQGRKFDALVMVNTIVAIDPSYQPALRFRETIQLP